MSTSTNGTSATTAPHRFGIGVDHRAHQLAAGRAALDRDPAGLVKLCGDQALRDVDEIVEACWCVGELAVEEPLIAKVVAAADMGDGEGEAAVEQAQAVGLKAGGMAIAVGAIAVEEQLARCRSS